MHGNILCYRSPNHIQWKNSPHGSERTTRIVENNATTNNFANHARLDGKRRIQQPAQVQRGKISARPDHGNMDEGH
jgi:hypothetical protein